MNPRPSESLLASIGIDPRADVLSAQALETTPQAQGLSSDLTPAAALADTGAPSLSVGLSAEFARDGLKVKSLQGRPRVLLVSSRGKLTRATGAVTQRHPGLWLVDARVHPAALLFDDRQGILIEADTVFCVPASAPTTATLAGWESHAAPPIALDLGALLGGAPVVDWLGSLVHGYASGAHAYSRATAAGLLARYWRPAPGMDALLRAMSEDSPLRRAVAWFRALPPAARVSIRETAEAETGELTSLMEGFSDALDQQDGGAGLARHLAVRRDDLEAVVGLFAQDADALPLRATLDALDSRATTWSAVWPSIPIEGDPRLEALAADEPESWWALGTGL